MGPVTLSAGGSYFDTNGYVIWRDDQVGPIDEPAKLTSGTFLGRVDYRPSNSTRVYFDGSYADEDRKKGTPLGESGFITRSYGAGTEIATEDLGQWNVNLFHMSRDSHNFSTTVTPDRTSERPSGNEYKAPCMSIGANLGWSKQLVEAHRLSVGLDQTWLEGESFAYGGYSTATGDFTTDKHVQGKEHLIGAYLQDIWRITPQWQVVGSARFDVLRNFDASDVIVERSTRGRAARVGLPRRREIHAESEPRRRLPCERGRFDSIVGVSRVPCTHDQRAVRRIHRTRRNGHGRKCRARAGDPARCRGGAGLPSPADVVGEGDRLLERSRELHRAAHDRLRRSRRSHRHSPLRFDSRRRGLPPDRQRGEDSLGRPGAGGKLPALGELALHRELHLRRRNGDRVRRSRARRQARPTSAASTSTFFAEASIARRSCRAPFRGASSATASKTI